MEKIKFDFKSRTAIVTGGAQGFGFDITKRFLKSGAKVIMWDNDPKAIDLAIKEIDSPNLSSHVVDVSNYEEVEKRIKLEFPHKFDKIEDTSTERVKPTQNVASAKRSASTGRTKTVKLTPSQVAIAKRLGVPLEEYAKQLNITEGV